MNRDAELAAIETLAPGPDDTVLAIGFGPGVGIGLLAARLSSGRVIGIDPSDAMVKEASRRNARFLHDGKVELHQARVEHIPLEDATCHGAIAVNSAQLWTPFAAGVAELARVLRPGGRLVTLTHDWALERTAAANVGTWLEEARATLEHHAFENIDTWRAQADRGHSVALCARKTES